MSFVVFYAKVMSWFNIQRKNLMAINRKIPKFGIMLEHNTHVKGENIKKEMSTRPKIGKYKYLFLCFSFVFKGSLASNLPNTDVNFMVMNDAHVHSVGIDLIKDIGVDEFNQDMAELENTYKANPDRFKIGLFLGDANAHIARHAPFARQSTDINIRLVYEKYINSLDNKIPVYITPGNDDTPQYDYGYIDYEGHFSKHNNELEELNYSPNLLIHFNHMADDTNLVYYNQDTTDYLYRLRLGTTVMQANNAYLVGINTMPLDSDYKGSTQDGYANIYDLNKYLGYVFAHEGKAIIITHFPYGINVATSLIKGKKQNFYTAQYESKFKKAICKYSKNVSFILSGHNHMNDIRTIDCGQGVRIYDISFAAMTNVSPWNNFSSFSELKYNTQKNTINDIISHSKVGNKQWKTFSWLSEFGCASDEQLLACISGKINLEKTNDLTSDTLRNYGGLNNTSTKLLVNQKKYKDIAKKYIAENLAL